MALADEAPGRGAHSAHCSSPHHGLPGATHRERYEASEDPGDLSSCLLSVIPTHQAGFPQPCLQPPSSKLPSEYRLHPHHRPAPQTSMAPYYPKHKMHLYPASLHHLASTSLSRKPVQVAARASTSLKGEMSRVQNLRTPLLSGSSPQHLHWVSSTIPGPGAGIPMGCSG